MGPIDDIASGAWTRLRNLVGALDRVDRLETSSGFDGWLSALAQDDAALETTIREFLLRAMRLAADPINGQLLSYLDANGASSTVSLGEAVPLSRVELTERLNELARAGLTVQALDADRVEATPLARGFLRLLDDIAARTREQAQNDYLINPNAAVPLPQIHKRR